MSKYHRLLPYLQLFLLLIYLLCASRYTESVWVLLTMGVLPLFAVALMASGSAILVVGVARSLYKARLGTNFLLLAALQLAIAATRIGNWDYRLSQGMLATLMLGVGIGLRGAWLARKAGKSTTKG